jgi:hypothetical protein
MLESAAQTILLNPTVCLQIGVFGEKLVTFAVRHGVCEQR